MSDSPEVSLTQVDFSKVLSDPGIPELRVDLTDVTLADEDTNPILKTDGEKPIAPMTTFKIWHWSCIQIGVSTALNMPGTAKEEFFFPVEPKGAKGLNTFGYLDDYDIWGLLT